MPGLILKPLTVLQSDDRPGRSFLVVNRHGRLQALIVIAGATGECRNVQSLRKDKNGQGSSDRV